MRLPPRSFGPTLRNSAANTCPALICYAEYAVKIAGTDSGLRPSGCALASFRSRVGQAVGRGSEALSIRLSYSHDGAPCKPQRLQASRLRACRLALAIGQRLGAVHGLLSPHEDSLGELAVWP